MLFSSQKHFRQSLMFLVNDTYRGIFIYKEKIATLRGLFKHNFTYLKEGDNRQKSLVNQNDDD